MKYNIEILNKIAEMENPWAIQYLKKGGIHIKEENRGKFTAAAKRAGKSVQEYARDVLNNPNATTLQKRRANFARNAKKWKHQEGGTILPWPALNNINYIAIADPNFTREITGAGSIEYFPAESEGITYPNGYYKSHPNPGQNVILYNPTENDEQDIRLDALHIMPQDLIYNALNAEYRYAAKNSDVMYNAQQRYNEDAKNYGIENIDSLESYFNNEADGLLRNMFIEGTPEYIESRRYYPDKTQLREWNKPLLPYIDQIRTYLETGVKPDHVIDPIIIVGNR